MHGADRDGWADRAEADQIAAVWQVAAAWREVDPETFGPAAARIALQVRDAYNIDPDQVTVRTTRDLERNEPSGSPTHARDAAAADIDDAAGAFIAAAAALNAHEDQPDGDQESPQSEAATEPYDSTERREALAHRLETHDVDQYALTARVRASHAQGKPAQQATSAQEPATTMTSAPRRSRERGRER